MAITKNAKKAIRSQARKRVINLRRKRSLHDTVHAYKKQAAGQTKEAEAMLPKVYAELDKAAKRGIIKKNTAARTKSRLAKRLSPAQK
jgi:small subunit ribosomal protein S20